MGKLGNALILSPFATHPLDAGQRKRAFQTTSLLKEWGFSITFLHFAFETRWYWGHNSEDDAVLKEQWDGDVLHFYANKKVGLPPINGESHQLDEWWDDALGGYINNIFSKRQYDLFVVHNIWLSKAFDYAPYHCMKVLEMHDLFSQRAKEFEATGVSPEFFHCSETDEVFGLKRADLLFAIKEMDADWCMARDIGKTQVITIPYQDKSNLRLASTDSTVTAVKPLHHGKMVFGMIGSNNHFNRHAVHALIKELDVIIRRTFAPIEFVLAGSICRSIGECPVFVRNLGFVDQVSDFYSAVDVVMVPMLHGTGVKIKSVEALNYCKPVLFTNHSAEGTFYSGATSSSLNEMAKTASILAFGHEIPLPLLSSTYLALQNAKMYLERSKISFQQIYTTKRPSFVQILAPVSTTRRDSAREALAGILLYKLLTGPFRAAALAVHPVLMEFIPSVPSQPLPLVQDSARLYSASHLADILVISYSQIHMLDHLLKSEKQVIVLIDMRSTSAHHFASQIPSLFEQTPNSVSYIVTPQQASLLNNQQLSSAIVMPLINSRYQWDPHVNRGLIDESTIYKEDALPSELHEFQLSVNDSVMNEGIDSIQRLISNY
jgi:hypothetical protein